MLSDLRISLYELFGHVVPGAVTLAAVVIATWAVFYPRDPLDVDRLTSLPWYLLLLTAYLAGVGTQAVAGSIGSRLSTRLRIDLTEAALEPELRKLVERARQLLDDLFGLDFRHADLDWVFRVCDETVARSENASDRESYIYREGQFRALSVSFCAFAAAALARALVTDAAVRLDGKVSPIPSEMWFALAGGAFVLAVLSFTRFRYTLRRRFARAVAGFVVSQSGRDASVQTVSDPVKQGAS